MYQRSLPQSLGKGWKVGKGRAVSSGNRERYAAMNSNNVSDIAELEKEPAQSRCPEGQSMEVLLGRIRDLEQKCFDLHNKWVRANNKRPNRALREKMTAARDALRPFALFAEGIEREVSGVVADSQAYVLKVTVAGGQTRGVTVWDMRVAARTFAVLADDQSSKSRVSAGENGGSRKVGISPAGGSGL